MSLKIESEAFERLLGNIDKAFKSKAYGLKDAMQIVPDIQTMAVFLNTPEPDLLRRFIAQPAEEIIDNWTEEQDFSTTESQDATKIPGTNQKIAKQRVN